MSHARSSDTTFVFLPAAKTLGEGNQPQGDEQLIRLPAATCTFPRQVFAPYIDSGLTAPSGPYPQYDMVTALRTLGIRFFHLGYVTGDQNGRVVFGGYRLGSAWDAGLRRQIAEVRRLGGDVALSFGGANGADAELARTIGDVGRLIDTYAGVINAYGVRRVDFDIAESALTDDPSLERRARAIARLQVAQAAAGRPIDVWFSMAPGVNGFGPAELRVLKMAMKAGVEIAGVNLMAMNFSTAAPTGRRASKEPAPKNAGEMVISAAQHANRQLRAIFERPRRHMTDAQLWARMGITPMVGQNDVREQRFLPADAAAVLNFAREHGVGLVSMWSLNRDAATGEANYNSTGIAQEPHEFARAFAPYTVRA